MNLHIQSRTLKSRHLQANPEATIVFLECPYYFITRFNKVKITTSNSKTATNKHCQNLFINIHDEDRHIAFVQVQSSDSRSVTNSSQGLVIASSSEPVVHRSDTKTKCRNLVVNKIKENRKVIAAPRVDNRTGKVSLLYQV